MLNLCHPLLNNQAGEIWKPKKDELFFSMWYTMDNYVQFYFNINHDGSFTFRVWCRCLKKGCSPFIPREFTIGTLKFTTGWEYYTIGINNRKNRYNIINENYEYWKNKGVETLPYFNLIWHEGECNYGKPNSFSAFTVPKEFMPDLKTMVGRKLRVDYNHRQIKDVKWSGEYKVGGPGTWGIHDTAGGQQPNTRSNIYFDN